MKGMLLHVKGEEPLAGSMTSASLFALEASPLHGRATLFVFCAAPPTCVCTSGKLLPVFGSNVLSHGRKWFVTPMYRQGSRTSFWNTLQFKNLFLAWLVVQAQDLEAQKVRNITAVGLSIQECEIAERQNNRPSVRGTPTVPEHGNVNGRTVSGRNDSAIFFQLF